MRPGLGILALCAGLAIAACAARPSQQVDTPVEVRTDFPAGSQLADIIPLGNAVRVRIQPESEPINPSPWYAVSIRAERPADLDLVFDYGRYSHRYRPWVRRPDEDWQRVDDDHVSVDSDGGLARIRLAISQGDTVLAAQPIVDDAAYEAWYQVWLSLTPELERVQIGHSIAGRTLDAFILMAGEPPSDRPLVIILGRQHPPEVTGAFALDGFVRAALQHGGNGPLPFDLVILPLINPDGVALGHWRMNSRGLDLNRDWLERGEAETQAVWTYLQSIHMHDRERVVMIDFHSTHSDRLYHDHYGPDDWRGRLLATWLEQIRDRSGDAAPDPRATRSQDGTTAKAVFAAEIGALALTWEAGDNTAPHAARTAGAAGFTALVASWE